MTFPEALNLLMLPLGGAIAWIILWMIFRNDRK